MTFRNTEFRSCDVCGRPMASGEVGWIFHSYLYCPRCWKIHERNEREYEECHKVTLNGWGI